MGQAGSRFLVPTTVLAMQHFDTFVERMRNFLSGSSVSFPFPLGKRDQRDLKGVAEGSVDILIGTHAHEQPGC